MLMFPTMCWVFLQWTNSVVAFLALGIDDGVLQLAVSVDCLLPVGILVVVQCTQQQPELSHIYGNQ